MMITASCVANLPLDLQAHAPLVREYAHIERLVVHYIMREAPETCRALQSCGLVAFQVVRQSTYICVSIGAGL